MPYLWKPRREDPKTGAPRVVPIPVLPGAPYTQEQAYAPREDGSMLRLLLLVAKEDPQGEMPGIVWIHGGGYVSGMPEMAYGGMPSRLVAARPCVVVCPDYRLAAEMPWPGGLEDCHTALVWLRDHAAELGVADDRIMVGGESAGGGLASALCLYERDLIRAGRDGVAVCFHMPLYPMLDDRPTPSSADNHSLVWDSDLNRQAWNRYLLGVDRSDVSPYAAPARAVSYEGMPPGVTFVGALEPFLDETVTYVRRMRADGAPMDFRLYRDCNHGFDLFTNNDQAQSAREFVLRKFSAACDECSVPQPTETKEPHGKRHTTDSH